MTSPKKNKTPIPWYTVTYMKNGVETFCGATYQWPFSAKQLHDEYVKAGAEKVRVVRCDAPVLRHPRKPTASPDNGRTSCKQNG